MLEKSERYAGMYIGKEYAKRKEYTTFPLNCRNCKYRSDYECTKYKTKKKLENRLIPHDIYGRIKPSFCKGND